MRVMAMMSSITHRWRHAWTSSGTRFGSCQSTMVRITSSNVTASLNRCFHPSHLLAHCAPARTRPAPAQTSQRTWRLLCAKRRSRTRQLSSARTFRSISLSVETCGFMSRWCALCCAEPSDIAEIDLRGDARPPRCRNCCCCRFNGLSRFLLLFWLLMLFWPLAVGLKTVSLKPIGRGSWCISDGRNESGIAPVPASSLRNSTASCRTWSEEAPWLQVASSSWLTSSVTKEKLSSAIPITKFSSTASQKILKAMK
mmetsp:Transcript_15119/g.35825  ORF Transcript_15119/g.35825 Transcript_15119/m.35825 type:complete len:255 (-) Transcript_15119:252-1016(-)